MTYATPPLPDWLFTRITASYVRPMSLGSTGRYGTSQGWSSTACPASAAPARIASKPLLIASWWLPEKAV